MGFLSDSNQSIYLEVTEDGKLIRPLGVKPKSIWCHKIHEVKIAGPDGQTVTLRNFRYETCTAQGRNGAGCHLCNTPDPLWHKLPKENQLNKAGRRVDFPKSPIHVLPVFDHATQQVLIMKGGNQIFTPMDQWYDAQPPQGQDLRRCDWKISKTGKGMRTQYQATRMDASQFPITDELQAKAEDAVKKALEDRNPTDPAILTGVINGDPQVALPAGVNTQPALPPASTAPLANVQPALQPMPQVTQPTLPQVAAPVVIPQVVASSGTTVGKEDLDRFSEWISQQPEYAGSGAVMNLIPSIKEKIGHVDYYKLSGSQLEELKVYLTEKLTALRTK